MSVTLDKVCEKIVTITSTAVLTKIWIIQLLFNRFIKEVKLTTKVKSLCLKVVSNGCHFEINLFRYGINNDTIYLNGSIKVE
jgi:hypothetical protein